MATLASFSSQPHLARAASIAAGMWLLFSAREAHAQLHWDAGVHAGVARRIYTGGPGDGRFGPIAGVQGHVALLPLVRVGAYLSHDLSPTDDGGDARNVTSAGARVKVTSPWPNGKWHAWAFLGVGYVGVYARSYHRSFATNGGTEDGLVAGAGGGHVEIPFGLGIGYRVWRPWEITLEVGTRFGFAFTGSLYQDPGRTAFLTGAGNRHIEPIGSDTVTPFAVLGLSLDQ
ncbi:hypothetical protein LVJ94_44935 [Pendulispora rubella]|uniref:Outer membrane protein beta-barrel domain-containing protein n=1 Tax=Pendulispora rubella TaxID=2741070 RepID=A0ABZ2KZE4_9BACT